jgi:hypothetical protein
MKFNFTNVLLSLIVLYGLVWISLGLMRTIRNEQTGIYRNTKGEEKSFRAYWSSFDNKYWHFESEQREFVISKDSIGYMRIKVDIKNHL